MRFVCSIVALTQEKLRSHEIKKGRESLAERHYSAFLTDSVRLLVDCVLCASEIARYDAMAGALCVWCDRILIGVLEIPTRCIASAAQRFHRPKCDQQEIFLHFTSFHLNASPNYT